MLDSGRTATCHCSPTPAPAARHKPSVSGLTPPTGNTRAEAGNTALAGFGKLVAMPLVFTLGAWAAGFRGMELGVLMLMASSPSAAASYSMVRAMGGNATLAAMREQLAG